MSGIYIKQRIKFLDAERHSYIVLNDAEELDNEISRAYDAEAHLQTNIDEVTTRLIKMEQLLQNNAGVTHATDLDNKIEAITARLIIVEQLLQNNTEVARATAAEKQLDDKIKAEVIRAGNAENRLDDKVEAITARLIKVEQLLHKE